MADIQARNEGKEPEHRGSDEILTEIAASLVPKPVEPNSTVAATSPHPIPIAPVSAAPTLSEVRDQWIEEGKAKEWSPKTGEARVIMVDLFIACAGDRPIDSYSKADARTFKDALASLPANWSKTKSLRTLPVAAAAKKAKADGMTPMSVTNVNKHLNCLYALMAWAAKHYDEIERNPFDGMRVDKKTTARDERDPFAIDDLKRMFAAPIFRGCQSEWHWSTPGAVVLRDSPKFWVPLIGLFTGARLNEILQLYRDDIVDVDGALCIRICAEKDDQRVKTASSRRLIPVHAELLRIGFRAFVASKSGRLFDTVEKAPDGYYSSTFSKHFVRFLDSVGVKRPKVSFHSFRHTFEDACRACGVPHDVMNALQGHSQGGMSDRYGGGQYPVARLVEEMGKLRHAGLDLSALAVVP
ncbi:MAG: site-specific integrase [Phyllobacteriaceae bacterium]|nr:site-specific integrase [Phyllobacteriaceae bacterium]